MLCILHKKTISGKITKKKVNVSQDELGQVFVNGVFRTNRPSDALNTWSEHADYGQQNWFTMLTPVNKYCELRQNNKESRTLKGLVILK